MDLAPGEPRARRHAELALHVLRRVEQHAASRLPVTSGPPSLLEVVLQRSGNVGVDNQPHVRLVDPHAEGVGGRDDPQLALDEALLHALLDLGRQLGMEVIRRDVLLLEEFRHLLGLPARRAVDDGATGHVRRKIRHQYLVKVSELLAAGGRYHREFQVLALSAAVEDRQLDAELVAEMGRNVLHHFRLRGCGEAEHRRNRTLSRLLADEAPHVAVVGPEVVPPLRQAVGFVQHPGGDLALLERPAQARIAELLRRDDKYARVSESDSIQGVRPFGQRQQSVDGDAGHDAARLQPRHLVCHERDER